jgi:drug/metabolite transporter (DMT)-like permease
MVCYAIFIAIQSNSLDVPVVSLLAGLLGLFWGCWYLRIAFIFHPTSPQAIGLCALAAVNSSFGMIIGTQTGLSKLASVTVSGCYTILLGVQIYITGVMFHREPTHEKVLDQP